MDGIKLHLGCGKVDLGRDWVHVDQVAHPHVDHVCDIAKLPFPDESASIIYACHVLEYFDWQEAETIVLPEWKRVLKPGGVLRLAVPDFDAIVNYYYDDENIDKHIGLLYGRQFYNGKWQYHKCAYDLEVLFEILQSVGFRLMYEWNWRQTEHDHIDDCSQAYLPHMDKENGTLMSLNIEAVK